MDKEVMELMEEWYRQILRYSRRDQLSLVYSEMSTGTTIHKIVIDNLSSEYHAWPIYSTRDNSKRAWSPSLSGAHSIFEKIKNLKQAENELDSKLKTLMLMNKEVAEKYKPTEPPSGFDPELYLALNKDVADAGVDPVKHFLNFGWIEGRRWR
ncbi:hypothetical protein [Pantoea sp.]|uniref:hypothetical protein n=1 Tax=Pantoea sp. TaxID=69393 RepID=UPI0028A0F825|nr:hypothetical protein [Pantoea sp.]